MAEMFLGGTVDPATHERTGDDVRIDTDSLTTHGVIVGMTGSGKTGLGIVSLEEALSAGLPALVIDPKGDLTNLCLTFPDLAPSDFEPWVDPSDADGDPSTYAEDQAKLWTEGLADWGYSGDNIAALRSTTDFSIYTPGSGAGLPLNIIGSLEPPADLSDDELVSDEIEGYVSGLLGLVGIDADPLSSPEHILLSNLIAHEWEAGRDLDLPRLVGLIGDPPIRKLGVFELEQFFERSDRMEFAMRLNGLLASPAFAAWADGPPLDIDSMLYTDDGSGRCAIVTTAHLSDDERQFVTSLVLSKLVTWMRRQSGTSDLRALLYMDEVAGYLPPTAQPPTKKPIMTLMKQARAFGVGVVLSTQNPVDIDYKALSNAGTWMIGRLSTERDKQRLLDGMTSAAGDVDIDAVDDTISGLDSREFVLRSPGAATTSVFTTRWAMSYLRGPLTRDQIAELMGSRRPTEPDDQAATEESTDNPATELADNETTVAPEVADGTPVRYIDTAAPWLNEVGGNPAGAALTPVIMAKVNLRYDERSADLTHDEVFECVITGLGESVDVTAAHQVDFDERDQRTEPPDGAVYRMTDAKIQNKTLFSDVERDLRDHLYRTMTLEIPANEELDLHGRPGETADEFLARCRRHADERATAAIAELRDDYESKVDRINDKIAAAEDRVDVLSEQASSRKKSAILDAAGSILGGLLGGRSKSSMLKKIGRAAGATSGTDQKRLDAAENKVTRLNDDLHELELELQEDLRRIDEEWTAKAESVTKMQIDLEKNDIDVAALTLAWLPTD